MNRDAFEVERRAPSNEWPGNADAESFRRCSLLLIEDDRELRDVVARRFRRKGCAVTAVRTGAAALEAVRWRSFDAAICDQSIPGRSGLDLVVELIQRDPALKIVVLSATADSDMALESRRRGAYAYLAKPCRLGMLQTTIEAAVASRAGRDTVATEPAQTPRSTRVHDATSQRRPPVASSTGAGGPWDGDVTGAPLERRVRNFLIDRNVDGRLLSRVQVCGGTVLLSGRVDSIHDRWLLVNCCQRVAGVMRVCDRLEVAPADSAPATSLGSTAFLTAPSDEPRKPR